MTLDELPRGIGATVTRLSGQGAQRRRMMDLGVLPGATVRAELTSPLGDPTAYEVRGGLVVLRHGQAREIHVEPDADDLEGDRAR